MFSAQPIHFRAASRAEIVQRVDCSAVEHLAQLEEALVRRQIRIEDLSHDLFSAFENLRRGEDPHPVQSCVKLYQTGNIRFVLLERVDIAFRSLLDELFLEVLPAQDLLRGPLCVHLRPLGQPRRDQGCESAKGGSHERCKGRNDGCVHAATGALGG